MQQISTDFNKIAFRRRYDCPINLKRAGILFLAQIKKMWKFEMPQYPGTTPLKNSIYFWVEKVKFLIVFSKTQIFTFFATDHENSSQTRSNYEVSKDLKGIQTVFKFFSKIEKTKNEFFLEPQQTPLYFSDRLQIFTADVK